MEIYQYISLFNKPDIIERTLHNNVSRNIFTVLDLEDSIKVPGDDNASMLKKRTAREVLMGIRPELISSGYTGIRINSPDTREIKEDLKSMDRLTAPLTGFIVLPKVSSSRDLQNYGNLLKKHDRARLIPLIETGEGVEKIEEICLFAKSCGIKNIHFGHWDYFLDTGTFPFPGQHSAPFWNLIKSLIRSIENNGLNYLHTPYNQLFNHNGQSHVISLLFSECKREFGISTLSSGQSRNAKKFNHNVPFEIQPFSEPDLSNATEIAGKIRREFTNSSHSFSINKTNEFIAPQEFIAACNYLRQLNG